MSTVHSPVPVVVTITKTPDGCQVTCTPEEVTLHKNPANGPNRATWTWTGADYDRAWVVFQPNDLRKCLNGHFVKDGKQGFEIVMPGGTTKTVNPASDCPTGDYNHDLRAISDEGDVCGVDPKVRIDD
jgi:hypothetical protein